ncbi:MAG TPA: radical SAM protein, partial [Ignavibacteriales bacterium]|nr:radical SAM protein [Ignavibacteriales bacterium]
HPLVDVVVINEGDLVFFELVKAFAENKNLSEVNGIGYKNNGKTRINKSVSLIDNLNFLPLFPYHLIDIPKYSSLSVNNLPSLDILTSRGCPYNCGFCSTPITSKRLWRAITVEKIIENIVFLKEKYGIATFYLVDDNFMVDLKRVEQFLDALKEANLKIYWGT